MIILKILSGATKIIIKITFIYTINSFISKLTVVTKYLYILYNKEIVWFEDILILKKIK